MAAVTVSSVLVSVFQLTVEKLLSPPETCSNVQTSQQNKSLFSILNSITKTLKRDNKSPYVKTNSFPFDTEALC